MKDTRTNPIGTMPTALADGIYQRYSFGTVGTIGGSILLDFLVLPNPNSGTKGTHLSQFRTIDHAPTRQSLTQTA